MTREDAKNWRNPFKDFTDNHKAEQDFFIDKIFDDFESRKCKSCCFDNCGCSVQDSIYFEAEANGRPTPDLDSFGCINWNANQ